MCVCVPGVVACGQPKRPSTLTSLDHPHSADAQQPAPSQLRVPHLNCFSASKHFEQQVLKLLDTPRTAKTARLLRLQIWQIDRVPGGSSRKPSGDWRKPMELSLFLQEGQTLVFFATFMILHEPGCFSPAKSRAARKLPHSTAARSSACRCSDSSQALLSEDAALAFETATCEIC